MRKTLKAIFAEYGAIAVVLYLVIFFAVFGGFWMGIKMGFRPMGVGGSVGAVTAAYLATKLTQPLRIGLTILLTPIVARGWERIAGKRVVADASAPDDPVPATHSASEKDS